MVRHFVRYVVKFGHYRDWMAAVKAENEGLAKLGMPPYRFFSADLDIANEVFSEAVYESKADVERFDKVLEADPEISKLIGVELSHVVDGSLHGYLLSEVTLD
ncbi:MAG: hypothetical protein ACLQBX_00745 [Candidatus Limnocylindrales bacterium]